MLLIPPVDKKKMWQQWLCDFVYIFHSMWPRVLGEKKASRRAAHAVMKPNWVAVCAYWREATDQRADVNLVTATGAYAPVSERTVHVWSNSDKENGSAVWPIVWIIKQRAVRVRLHDFDPSFPAAAAACKHWPSWTLSMSIRGPIVLYTHFQLFIFHSSPSWVITHHNK